MAHSLGQRRGLNKSADFGMFNFEPKQSSSGNTEEQIKLQE